MPRRREPPRRRPHREHHDWDHDCDCTPRPVLVTVTITDAAGNVRAVREGETFVRPHRHHDWDDDE